MAESAVQIDDKLELARSLVNHLESGDDDGAVSVIAELAGFRDSMLFQEVGRLTRELHDSINGFVMDAQLADIAQNEMPNAAERLRYVIATTEQAANTTLGAVEDSLPLADSLRSDARHLGDQWAKFKSRQLTVDDFRDLSNELSRFLDVTQANTDELHQKLSEVLLAQGYQDITGQIIRKVIDLVNDVESKLVELIRLSGHRAKLTDKAGDKAAKDIEAQGPAVPGVDKGDMVNGQDDVDDLLSSLGF
ncbi:MAG: protein phosphatase CheZ [Gammaproteobacteria bacterium]|nr:protein phosphatase CheZ [Gammaproteobacteria bacterium]MCB1922916.1 protein phosphatase CheZ [Gammaproteobacteria bacterium]